MRLTNTLTLSERPASWLSDLRASRLNLELVAKRIRVAAKAARKSKDKAAGSLLERMMKALSPEQRQAFEKGKAHGA